MVTTPLNDLHRQQRGVGYHINPIGELNLINFQDLAVKPILKFRVWKTFLDFRLLSTTE
ncbi:hypothetical protein SAMN03080602_01461 [Arenibacter troitsensis]|uniref:Uncharacterized protein n=1 Tax=Arenibacter troitsensis TaxID=188872 RepID=A0A1X7J8H4_9FLAO|nr:hypothetical protein SAMN03080602_01461 [Arenibacter troitsensis]